MGAVGTRRALLQTRLGLLSFLRSRRSPAVVYPMQEASGTTMTDAGPNASNVSLVGSGVTIGGAGQSGACYAFDGGTDAIDCGANTYGLLINGAAAVTVAFLLNLSGTPGAGATYQVLGLVREISGAGLSLAIDENRKVIVAGRSTTGDALGTVTSNTALTVGKSYAIIGVVDYANGRVSVYINGILDNTAAATFGSATYSNAFTSGNDFIGNFAGSSRYLNGKLSHLGLWKYGWSAREAREFARSARLA